MSRETGLSFWGWVLVAAFGCLALYGIFNFASHISNTETYENTSTQEVEIENEEDLKKDSIRSREEIKRQQELIVQETYLNEERERIEREKAEAIAEFDNQISEIELQLEAVRGEKLSFQ